jgi:drug/metabolite transporter (DMT)-like permease
MPWHCAVLSDRWVCEEPVHCDWRLLMGTVLTAILFIVRRENFRVALECAFMCSLLLLSWAYARAQAQVLVTVEYTAFIWASIFGWLFFREAVTLTTIIGTALIVTGCIIAARHKVR